MVVQVVVGRHVKPGRGLDVKQLCSLEKLKCHAWCYMMEYPISYSGANRGVRDCRLDFGSLLPWLTECEAVRRLKLEL